MLTVVIVASLCSVELTGQRVGFSHEYMRCEACLVFSKEVVKGMMGSRPVTDADHRRGVGFFKDEVRADGLVEGGVQSVSTGYHFVEYPDEKQKKGQVGTFVPYTDLLTLHASDPTTQAAIRSEMQTRDPGLLNFLYTFTATHEDILYTLIAADQTDPLHWAAELCVHAARYCTAAPPSSY